MDESKSESMISQQDAASKSAELLAAENVARVAVDTASASILKIGLKKAEIGLGYSEGRSEGFAAAHIDVLAAAALAEATEAGKDINLK